MEEFKKIGVEKDILSVLKLLGFKEPTNIQLKAIPVILKGKDVIAGSFTGSGKTLAFGIPIVQKIRPVKKIQCLILVPTRELAVQVSNSIEEISKERKIKVRPIYGGVSIEKQIKEIPNLNIVVATPGRLLDHLQRKSINLDDVKFLVLDEADRMWDMGFQEEVSRIVKKCPKSRQTLLFSATIARELEDFSKKHMKSPIEINVENYVDPSKLRQVYYDIEDNRKFSLLVHLLKKEKQEAVMVFCNTRKKSDLVNRNLRLNGIKSQAIHGGMSQSKRSSTLRLFDNSKLKVLVCTDVAARGLDISGISHVYNYEIPNDAKDYVHRIGRTARAGNRGIAVNLISSKDYENFSKIQRENPDMEIKREETPKIKRAKMEERKFKTSKTNQRFKRTRLKNRS